MEAQNGLLLSAARQAFHCPHRVRHPHVFRTKCGSIALLVLTEPHATIEGDLLPVPDAGMLAWYAGVHSCSKLAFDIGEGDVVTLTTAEFLRQLRGGPLIN